MIMYYNRISRGRAFQESSIPPSIEKEYKGVLKEIESLTDGALTLIEHMDDIDPENDVVLYAERALLENLAQDFGRMY